MVALFPVNGNTENQRGANVPRETVPFNINNLPDGAENQEKVAQFIYKDMEEWPDGEEWTMVIKVKFRRDDSKIRASFAVVRPKPEKIDWPTKAGVWLRENGTIRLEKSPDQGNLFEQPTKTTE